MRHGILAFVFVLAAGLFLDGDLNAGSLEPPGGPAPTMKTLSEIESRTPISSLPFAISAPGSYYLTGDLTGVAGQAGITITASHVTLDLNGFSLIGVPGSLIGIDAITVATVRQLAIRNGVIRNWNAAGIAADSSSVHVDDLLVDSNSGSGMLLGANSIVRNTTARQNGGNGISATGNSSITACTATGNGVAGIQVGAFSVVSGSTSSGNLTGILLSSASTATDCTVSSNTSTGFSLQGLGPRVVHSAARGNAVGITAGDGASVEECTADGNTDDGIRIANRGLVRGNLVRGNTNDGIQATGSGNRIEENETTQNSTGIRVDGVNNLVVKNSSFLNTTEFAIVAGNKAGAISADPLNANPWANFDL